MSAHQENLNIISTITKFMTANNCFSNTKLQAYAYIQSHRNFKKYANVINKLLKWNGSNAKVFVWIDNIKSVIDLLNAKNTPAEFSFNVYEKNDHYTYVYPVKIESTTEPTIFKSEPITTAKLMEITRSVELVITRRH